jgi:predicted N-acyltransferase
MQWINRIKQVDDALWDTDFPFLQKPFLNALENHDSLNGESGWQSHYLHLPEQNIFLPSFIKQHSYGEYVFDWGWAEAYQNHGLNYYPKLIVAAPFTPVPGPRLIGKLNNASQIDGKQISKHLHDHCQQEDLSGAHCLFINEQERKILKEHNWHERKSVQFLWNNYQYQSFEHFLSTFKSRKRKAILKERRLIQDAGITVLRLSGEDITDQHWRYFYNCYQSTYNKRGMSGYITLDAFKAMGKAMPDQLLLILAQYKNQPLACALYFKDKENLYGRFWGCQQEITGLHFELCYYQGIEYCIENNLKHFNPGTQGEHKIARGFEATFCYSLHYLTHTGFHDAVGDFVYEEAKQLAHYKQGCYEQLPFNSSNMPEPC